MQYSYDMLKKLYIDEDHNTAEMGVILGVSQTMACKILREHKLTDLKRQLKGKYKPGIKKEARPIITSKKDCAKCQYRGYDTNLGGLYCNYFEVTGRIRPCPGNACTEYIKGPRKRSRFAGVSLV